MTIEDVLKRSEIFLGLDDSRLKIIAGLPSTREMYFESGQVLFRAGDRAENLYILEEGQINLIVEIPVAHDNNKAPVTVDILTKGSLLGWSAILRPHIYALTAICEQPAKAVLIRGNELLSLFEQDCSIGYRVLLGLSQVIGTRYRDLQQVLIKGRRWPFIERHTGT